MEPDHQLEVTKWDHRHWAVYDGSELVCVTVYKRGALEVMRRLEHATSPAVETSSNPPYVRAALASTPAALPRLC
jgi:hypothetical protein